VEVPTLRIADHVRVLTGSGDGDDQAQPWDRIPALVSAAIVINPVAAVPAMGFGVIFTGHHGIGWNLIAGLLAFIGLIGLVLLVAVEGDLEDAIERLRAKGVTPDAHAAELTALFGVVNALGLVATGLTRVLDALGVPGGGSDAADC